MFQIFRLLFLLFFVRTRVGRGHSTIPSGHFIGRAGGINCKFSGVFPAWFQCGRKETREGEAFRLWKSFSSPGARERMTFRPSLSSFLHHPLGESSPVITRHRERSQFPSVWPRWVGMAFPSAFFLFRTAFVFRGLICC